MVGASGQSGTPWPDLVGGSAEVELLFEGCSQLALPFMPVAADWAKPLLHDAEVLRGVRAQLVELAPLSARLALGVWRDYRAAPTAPITQGRD